MSLFIGSLAFLGDEVVSDLVRIAVLTGSLLSMLFGIIVMISVKKSDIGTGFKD